MSKPFSVFPIRYPAIPGELIGEFYAVQKLGRDGFAETVAFCGSKADAKKIARLLNAEAEAA